jgi:hypothetical protein
MMNAVGARRRASSNPVVPLCQREAESDKQLGGWCTLTSAHNVYVVHLHFGAYSLAQRLPIERPGEHWQAGQRGDIRTASRNTFQMRMGSR